MMFSFSFSNLSKISTKFRTSGNISQPRRKAGSPLKDIGVTDVEVVKCATQQDYLNRLYYAFDLTTDPKLRQFLYTEIKKIHIQRGTW